MIFTKIYDWFSHNAAERPNYNIDSINLSPWWGEVFLEDSNSYFGQINDVVVYIYKEGKKIYLTNFNESKLKEFKESSFDKLLQNRQLNFKVFSWKKQRKLCLLPAFPNKPLISKILRPLHILPKESVWVYMSSPILVKLVMGKSNILLDEIDIYKLTHTWLGSNTLAGECCYHSHDKCSTELTDVTDEVNKVITPILITNKTRDILQVNSVCLPLPFLSIYNQENNYLWTEEVHIFNYEDKQVEFSMRNPDLNNFKLLVPARKKINNNGMCQKLIYLLTGHVHV